MAATPKIQLLHGINGQDRESYRTRVQGVDGTFPDCRLQIMKTTGEKNKCVTKNLCGDGNATRIILE